MSTESYAIISTLHGYTQKEGSRVDQKRAITRVGFKKETNTPINLDQAQQLKAPFSDTQQGRRDALLMCILLDHGLRVGELVPLQVISIDSVQKLLVFYRSKVQKMQRHFLLIDTFKSYKPCRSPSYFAAAIKVKCCLTRR